MRCGIVGNATTRGSMRLSEAAALYLGDVARRCAPRTLKKYSEEIEVFTDYLGDLFPVEEVSSADCLSFLNRWNNRAPKTKALKHTVLKEMFVFLERMGAIEKSPMKVIARPKVPPVEDRKIKSISTQDVQKMFGFCETWTEKLCIGVLAYMGVRRGAANSLRWKDVNLEEGYIRFMEKGSKSIKKPIPTPLLELLKAYTKLSEGEWYSPSLSSDAYVIPSVRPTNGNRDARFIWRTVKEVGKRAGVDTHCHSFRAAFAVHFLESFDGDTLGLMNAMGHSHISTTQGYWRRLNKQNSMEPMRDLDYGASLMTAGHGTQSSVLHPVVVSEDDSEGHVDAVNGQKRYVTKPILRGKDSNLDSMTKQHSSKSQRTSKAGRRKRQTT